MVLTMQLIPFYKAQLRPEFVAWYLHEFKSDRLIHDHWSAGYLDGNFTDYHVVTLQENSGRVHTAFNGDVMVDMYEHTSGRNTNSIGTAIACMYGGQVGNLGNYKPTPAQIRSHLQTLADICCNHRIPFGNYGTHQERADMLDYQAAGIDPNDPNNLGAPPYGPINGRGQWACYRWDWYVDIDASTLHVSPRLTSGIVIPNRQRYADFFRGQLALEIQRRTQSHWLHLAVQPPTGLSPRSHGEGK